MNQKQLLQRLLAPKAPSDKPPFLLSPSLASIASPYAKADKKEEKKQESAMAAFLKRKAEANGS
jgi:hypothetical protein